VKWMLGCSQLLLTNLLHAPLQSKAGWFKLECAEELQHSL
jgi:hypothetical protein